MFPAWRGASSAETNGGGSPRLPSALSAGTVTTCGDDLNQGSITGLAHLDLVFLIFLLIAPIQKLIQSYKSLPGLLVGACAMIKPISPRSGGGTALFSFSSLQAAATNRQFGDA